MEDREELVAALEDAEKLVLEVVGPEELLLELEADDEEVLLGADVDDPMPVMLEGMLSSYVKGNAASMELTEDAIAGSSQ